MNLRGREGCPCSLVIAVEWLVTLSPLNPALVHLARKSCYLKTLRCIAEPTVITKISLIIQIIFWTETCDAKPLLLNAPEPFTWQPGVSWRLGWGFLRRVRDEETEDVPAGLGSVAEGPQ